MNARKFFAALMFWASLEWSHSALGAASANPPTPGVTRYVIGLSPFLDRSVKDDIFRQIVGFVLKAMPLGSSLQIYDAYYLQTIATLEIPDVVAFKSEKTRANQLKSQVNQLK